jgi:hypothetical protein
MNGWEPPLSPSPGTPGGPVDFAGLIVGRDRIETC